MDKKSEGTSRPSRRNFIAAATAGAAAASLSSVSRATPKPDQEIRDRPRWRVQAQRIEETFSDGSTVPFFRFVSVGNTRTNGRLPFFRAFENRPVCVSIENLVAFPIQPTILNYASGPVVMPGETVAWNFNMPPSGTWVFSEELLGIAASSAGFGAAMVSRSTSSKTMNREYFLMYQDADDRWNNAIDNGNVPDETLFEPNYHTVNGLSYPHTVMDDDTRINCTLGEDVLIRIANHSNIRHSLHFHGYHANLINRNNVPESIFPEKDTFPFPANSTGDIILPITQVGEYPLHPHSLTATTDNGTYQGGSVTMIDAQA